MLNNAFRPSAPTDDPSTSDRYDLERVGTALVQLDAWCRQRGMEELAGLTGAAADWADDRLTGR